MESHRKDHESWSVPLDRQRYGQVVTIKLHHHRRIRGGKVLGTGKLLVSCD